MKNLKLFISLVLLTVSFVTFSQHKPFQFGFKGGVNMGWFATDTEGYGNNGVRVGGSWGFVADFFIMEGYSFTTGFDVIYLNGSVTSSSSDSGSYGKYESDYKNKYIELPLIFTMKTKNIKEKVRIYGQIGFGLSFLLTANASEIYYPPDGRNPEEQNKNVYNDFRFTRESLILGVGVEIPIQRSMYVRTGIKFDNAFIDVLKDEDAKARNNFLELTAAVIF